MTRSVSPVISTVRFPAVFGPEELSALLWHFHAYFYVGDD